jgi:predicted transglutaminase-like protease
MKFNKLDVKLVLTFSYEILIFTKWNKIRIQAKNMEFIKIVLGKTTRNRIRSEFLENLEQLIC